MANAAAKKAAAARQAASTSYLPIVVVLDTIYLLLRFVYQYSSITTCRCLGAFILVSLSIVSYRGILEDHANNNMPKGGTKKGGGSSSSNNAALAGGASLDLLGLVVVIQYGSVFVTEKVYWLLLSIPLWAGWKVYSTFFGSSSSSKKAG